VRCDSGSEGRDWPLREARVDHNGDDVGNSLELVSALTEDSVSSWGGAARSINHVTAFELTLLKLNTKLHLIACRCQWAVAQSFQDSSAGRRDLFLVTGEGEQQIAHYL
jgi:hypothetical protein